MAMMGQIGKQILTIAARVLLALVLVLPAVAQATTAGIVVDPLTGVAIDGYDPVSYFTETEPLVGKPDHEYVWGGVSWYFATQANRDVFIRAPEVYAPRHGGHCVMSLARGYLSDGKSRIYTILAQRLYFFYSAANRDAFLLAPGSAVRAAEANWENLAKTLVVN